MVNTSQLLGCDSHYWCDESDPPLWFREIHMHAYTHTHTPNHMDVYNILCIHNSNLKSKCTLPLASNEVRH